MNKLLRAIPCICTTAALLAPTTATAVPAKPELQPVVQPDGTTILARQRGDEHSHFTVNESDLPIGRGADGLFYYYACGSDERPVLSAQRVADPTDAAKERAFVASLEPARLRNAFMREREAALQKRVSRRLPPQVNAFPCTGSPRGLVLLIEYSDVEFTVPDANDAFTRMLNQEGYSDLGAWGSARDWFISNSGGRFTPEFDVVGPIRLSHPRAYYGANKGGNDVRPEMMIIEACGLIADDVDFSLYDEDNDGFIDNVFAFYAGYGENLGAAVPSECVWPHSWDIVDATSVPYYFNGKRLNHYACTNEIDLTDTMDGIGTFVHEFSHVMGLPDLYATNYSFAFTPGKWSVMDEGPYNNNSRTPPCYSAFERLSLGWLDPVQVSGPASLKIPPIAENRAYWIATENENEYYLLENRQQEGWDTFLPHHGMLVWHIDYNENIWHYNTVNDRKDHQYVDLIEADNHPHADTVEGDAFPGLNNVTSFTDDTEPAMRSWAGKGCGVPLTDIFESNGYIYLKACGGKTTLTPPTAYEATGVGVDSFTANWQKTEEEGCSHVLSVYTVSTTAAGQTSIAYVEGYENLDLGPDATSAEVTDLMPGGEYRYSVRVHDPESGLQSAPSNEVTVKLSAPTFDYLTPLALDATDISDTGFTARWQTLEGADRYLLTIVSKVMGAPERSVCGFDNGLSDLPAGWVTNSKLTYAADDYCGESVPALRMNTEGHYLEIASPDGYVRGLTFWHRAIATNDEASLELTALVAGKWQSVSTVSLSQSGADVELTEEILPFGAEAVRLVFHPSGKGSVAIDDVTLLYGGESTVEALPAYTDLDAGTATGLEVKGLRPQTPYHYTVKAASGAILSKTSNEIRVVTTNLSSVGKVNAMPTTWSYDPATSTLSAAGLRPGSTARIIDLHGIVTATLTADFSGNAACVIPAGTRVAILVTEEGEAMKVITSHR